MKTHGNNTGKTQSLYYSDYSWVEMKELIARDAVAVLPIGSTEQHGRHMAICTDDHMAQRWAYDSAERAQQQLDCPVLVLPGIHFGNAVHHMRFPGTISLSFETLKALTSEVVQSLIDHGFRKIVILNVHGGNRHAVRAAAVDIYARNRREQPQLHLRVAEDCDPDLNPLIHARDALAEHSQEARNRSMVHGGALETAKMLYLKPEVVDLAKCEEKAVAPDSRQEVLFYDEKTPLGSMGDPAEATVEAGRIMWEALVSSFTEYLVELGRRQ